MVAAQILGYPLLVISALELFLGILLLRMNPRNSPVNKATAACAQASALWSLCAGLMYLSAGQGRDYLLFARMNWVGWFTVPSALQTVLFMGNEQSRKARIVGWVLYPFWAAVLGLSLFTDLVVTDGYVPLPYRNAPGPLEMLFRATGSIMAFWLIAEIILLRRRLTGFRRSQVGYYLGGTIIFTLGGAFIGGVLQLFTGRGLEPSLSSYFSLPWVVMIFYAITRYRLFDIRIVISRVVNILLLSFMLATLLYLLHEALSPVVGDATSIFLSIPLIVILFFATPMSGMVRKWVDDLVFRGRYEYQKMLRESSKAMITILHFDELLDFIVRSVRQGMDIEHVSLALFERDGRCLIRELGEDGKMAARFGELSPQLVKALSEGRRSLIREDLEGDLDPQAQESAALMAQTGAEVMVLLEFKGRVLGAMLLGRRASGEHYLYNDLEVLETLAGHASTAIENARLFEETGQMRTSLREQEEMFRTLAQTLPAAIFIHRGGKFLYANPAGVRMTGYTMDEILQKEFWELVHPEYRQLVTARGRSRLDGSDAPQQYEFKVVRKDWVERWVLMTAGLIEYEGKAAVIGTILDITDRKRAEEERERYLRERIAEQARFAAVVSATNEGFWICDDKVRFQFVNDAYCRMLGYTREELLALSVRDVETDDGAAQVEARARRIALLGHDLFETRHRRKDGTLLDLEINVNRFKDGDLFFSFGRDITDRKRAEQERARLASEKEKILKDLHDGIGGMTTNINLLAELARKSDDMTAIKSSLGTIAELSRESLSEIRSFIQSLDVRELSWQSMAADFRSLGNTIVGSHGIRFTIRTDVPENGEAPSSAMAMNLYRIFKESLANVIKHAHATEVTVLFTVGKGQAKLEVRDNGSGIRERSGSGRGLLNMRSRAEEIGGAISFISDKGTNIALEIPLP